MSSLHPSLPHGSAWLPEYDAMAEPMPPRLTALLEQLEMSADEAPSGRFKRPPPMRSTSQREPQH
jgi:hypothetical protein